MINIRPIRTEADYDWALAEIAPYFEVEPDAGTAEADRFDVLAALIEAYEAAKWPIEAPDPIDAIRAVLEMRGLKAADLGRVLGSAPRASEVLNRRRALTIDMAFRINRELGVPAEVLLQPYHLERRARAAA